MLKLTLCLLCTMLLGVVVLQIRQQKLELNFQCHRLHQEIRQRQNVLWSQQLQIAMYTAPNAIEHTVGNHQLGMVPEPAHPAAPSGWIDARHNPDAE
jgi:hypothetical protein